MDLWLEDPYFSLAAPKSTGREYFNPEWLKRALQQFEEASAADVQATLCELTARATTDAISEIDAHQLVVCGGGRLNKHLLSRLQHHSTARVCASEDLDFDGDAIEAAAFAWLAYRTIARQSGNEPAVTGANAHRILGGIYLP